MIEGASEVCEDHIPFSNLSQSRINIWHKGRLRFAVTCNIRKCSYKPKASISLLDKKQWIEVLRNNTSILRR